MGIRSLYLFLFSSVVSICSSLKNATVQPFSTNVGQRLIILPSASVSQCKNLQRHPRRQPPFEEEGEEGRKGDA